MNIPNSLSLLRFVLIPVFVLVYFSGSPVAAYWAAAIFLLATVTDMLDGYAARKLNQITKLGRILDPLADKIMKATVAVCLMIAGVVPLWVLIALVAKEVLILAGAAVLLKVMKDVPPANFFGKLAEGYMCVLYIILIAISMPQALSLTLLVVALSLELLALGIYGVKAGQKLKAERGKQ